MNDKKSTTLNNWAEEDKPREKMQRLGKKNLSNAELLAILLGNGIVGTNVVEIARNVLQTTNNNLIDLSKKSIADLKKIDGIGDAKALLITAAMELGYRMINERNDNPHPVIKNSKDLFHYISPQLMDLSREEFWAIYLNNANRVLYSEKIAQGGLSSTTVDIRCIYQIALEKKASAIAVAHNHPSGRLTPSPEDIALTKSIKAAGDILKIKMIDHLIVGVSSSTVDNYYSFAENDVII